MHELTYFAAFSNADRRNCPNDEEPYEPGGP